MAPTVHGDEKLALNGLAVSQTRTGVQLLDVGGRRGELGLLADRAPAARHIVTRTMFERDRNARRLSTDFQS